MKRLVIWIILILGLTACSSTSTPQKSLMEINYDEFQTKAKNEENYILYIGSTTCSHCQEFKPVLEEVIAEYSLDVYYLDIYKLDKDQNTYVWDVSKIKGTPTIVFVKNGEIELFPRIIGTVSKSTLIQKFKSAGYIK